MTTPTKAASAASARYLRRRRRCPRLASSISASTRASISSRSSGLLSGALRAGEGGRGGVETVIQPPVQQLASIASTLISVKVNKEDGTDLLYLQVAAQIRRAIADGEAKPGERLPPARDLATVLGVNTNTVLRSLRLLQDEGLLELRRRRGITVAGTPERGAVIQKVRELVEFARGQGYAVDELLAMIEDCRQT